MGMHDEALKRLRNLESAANDLRIDEASCGCLFVISYALLAINDRLSELTQELAIANANNQPPTT